MKVLFFAAILPTLATAFVPAALKAGTASKVAFAPETGSVASFMENAGSRCSASAMAKARSMVLQATDDGSDVNGNAEKKKVIVLGGDGFCGWPTSLYLSDQGHDIVVVDNLSRRNIDTELGCDSLTPIQSPEVSYVLVLVSNGNYFWVCLSLASNFEKRSCALHQFSHKHYGKKGSFF